MCFIILVCCHFKIHPFAISLIASRANHSFPRRCTLVACSQHELYRATRPLIDIPDCFSRYCTHLTTTASSEPFAEAARFGVEAALSRFPDFHAMPGEVLRALGAIPHRSLSNPNLRILLCDPLFVLLYQISVFIDGFRFGLAKKIIFVDQSLPLNPAHNNYFLFLSKFQQLSLKQGRFLLDFMTRVFMRFKSENLRSTPFLDPT